MNGFDFSEFQKDYKRNSMFLRKLKQLLVERNPLLSGDPILVEMAKIAWPYSREACESLETKSLDRQRLDVKNYSGYYRITAKLFYRGLYGHVTYSRGQGLSDLRKVDGINELLFQKEALDEMKADELEELFGLTHLDDIFTADEVSEIIKLTYMETMNISIEPVLWQELTQYMTKSFLPLAQERDGGRTWMAPHETDKFTLTITWRKELLD